MADRDSDDDATLQCECPRSQGNGIGEPYRAKIADQGYAYVVAFSLFFLNVWTAGFLKSIGLLYVALLSFQSELSATQASTITMLCVAFRGLMSPITGMLTSKFGVRPVVIFGSFLISSGLFISAFFTNLIVMAVCQGFVLGSGFSMVESAPVIAIQQYFSKKKARGNGIRMAGVPMGGIIFPPLTAVMLEMVGYRNTLLLWAGLLLHVAIAGTLIRPFELNKKLEENKARKSIMQENKEQINLITETSNVEVTFEDKASKETCQSEQNENMESNIVCDKTEKRKRANLIDLKLLKEPSYILMIAMVILASGAFPTAQNYFAAYGTSIGLTQRECGILMSILSCVDFVSRLSIGFCSDHRRFNQAWGFVASLSIASVGCLLLPLTTQLWQLAICCSFWSIGVGYFWVVLPILLCRDFGLDRLPSSWGFTRMVNGCVTLGYPIIVGLIADQTGGYGFAFFLIGSSLVLAALTLALRLIALNRGCLQNDHTIELT